MQITQVGIFENNIVSSHVIVLALQLDFKNIMVFDQEDGLICIYLLALLIKMRVGKLNEPKPTVMKWRLSAA